jgi:penicillin-binding protein 1B
VPSRVYTAPTILYPGLDIDRVGLTGILERLSYRRESDGRIARPGGFFWERDRLKIHLRAFDHPTRPEPARRISLELYGREIDQILDLDQKRRELSAVLVEPEPVGAYFGPNREQRELVSLDEVPESLIAAVLAVEDQRFERHRGIDWRRVAGAFWANLRARGIRQGGSTLTQQLVKNFFLTPERTLGRKAQEAVMALLVESRYDKEDILEAYLNEIYLGQRGPTSIHGVGEAARAFFGKAAGDLALHESALLAAMIQSPNGVSPYRNPKRAIERRNLVLHLMRRQGRISPTELFKAQDEPILLATEVIESQETRYFLDALRVQLPHHFDAESLASDGMRIYSTLDLRLQHHAVEAMGRGLEELERRFRHLAPEGRPKLQGCLVVLRPQTGEVLAMVGGRKYSQSQYNRCTQARRPAGSVFKPFVYVAALERATGPVVTLASSLDDSPLTVETPAGPWSPANYDLEFHGQVGVREAFERSLNVATARLAQEVGIARVVSMAIRLGIESHLPEVPSLALGAADLSPVEIARAYSTLANGGVRPEIRFFEDVVDADQNTLEQRALEFERVVDPATAFLAVTLLEGVVEAGTARRIRRELRGPVAGKTGTSDESKDVWFVGFTPELVAAVWLGYDEPRSLRGSASQLALPIWLRFMHAATGGEIRGAFLPPPGVKRIEIDPLTGARALPGCPRRRSEYFLTGTLPKETCPAAPWQRRRPRDSSPGVIERLFDRWLWGRR